MIAYGSPEPCSCGATDCRRCYPEQDEPENDDWDDGETPFELANPYDEP